MRLDVTETIAGLSTKTVRDLLRKLGDSVSLPAVYHHWRQPSPMERRYLVTALTARYLLRPPGRHDSFTVFPHWHQGWMLTDAGLRLRSARATRPITRVAAEQIVGALVARAEAINCGEGDFAYLIGPIRVFGSYLGESPTLSDIDLSVELVPRDTEPRRQEAAEQERYQFAPESKHYLERAGWPRQEVLQFLQGSNRAIHWTDPYDLNRLATASRVLVEHPRAPVIETLSEQQLTLTEEERAAAMQGLSQAAQWLKPGTPFPYSLLLRGVAERAILTSVPDAALDTCLRTMLAASSQWSLHDALVILHDTSLAVTGADEWSYIRSMERIVAHAPLTLEQPPGLELIVPHLLNRASVALNEPEVVLAIVALVAWIDARMGHWDALAAHITPFASCAEAAIAQSQRNDTTVLRLARVLADLQSHQPETLLPSELRGLLQGPGAGNTTAGRTQ